MSRFLDRLVGQTLGTIPSLQPRPHGLFEPAPVEVLDTWIADRPPTAAPSPSTPLAEVREAARSGDEAVREPVHEHEDQTSRIDAAGHASGASPAIELDVVGPPLALSGRDQRSRSAATAYDLPASQVDTGRRDADRPAQADVEAAPVTNPIHDPSAGRPDDPSDPMVPSDNAFVNAPQSPGRPGPDQEAVVERPPIDRPATEYPDADYSGALPTATEYSYPYHPDTGQSASEYPVTHRPATQSPMGHRPVTQRVVTSPPATDGPVTQHPAHERPAAEPAASDAAKVTETSVTGRPVAGRPVARPVTERPLPTDAEGPGGLVEQPRPLTPESGMTPSTSGRQEAMADIKRRQSPDMINPIAAADGPPSLSSTGAGRLAVERRRPGARRASESENGYSGKPPRGDPLISVAPARSRGSRPDQGASISGDLSRTTNTEPRVTVEIGRLVITPPPITLPPAGLPPSAARAAPAEAGIRPLSLADYLSRRGREPT